MLLVLVWFALAASRLQTGASEQGRQQLETALRRSAVACYAAEGFYPPSLSYLKEHYGVQVDESRYIVFYEVYGENLMPQITVLERQS